MSGPRELPVVDNDMAGPVETVFFLDERSVLWVSAHVCTHKHTQTYMYSVSLDTRWLTAW